VREQYLKTFKGEECSFELTVNGQFQHYRTVPLENGDGSINRILAVVENITVRKKAEIALHASNETLLKILNTVPQSIFWKDTQGRYLGCNKVFAQAVGLADPDLIKGLTDYDLPWPKEEADAYRVDDQQVLQSNTAKMHILEPLETAEGKRLWIDTSKMPLQGDDGKPFGVLGVYDDVTDHQKMSKPAVP